MQGKPTQHHRPHTSARSSLLTAAPNPGSGAGRVPVLKKQETNYLAKLSSEPGARGATAEGDSENTSTSSPLEEGGGPAGAGGAAPSPRRSADGEGVDWKPGKGRVSKEPYGHTALSWGSTCAPPTVRPLGGEAPWPVLSSHCTPSQASRPAHGKGESWQR